MQRSTAKQSRETDRVAPDVPEPPPRRLFTLAKFAARNSSFLTLPALTNQVFKARPRRSSKGVIAGNGMLDYGAIVRANGRVFIDEDAYFRWLDAQEL